MPASRAVTFLVLAVLLSVSFCSRTADSPRTDSGDLYAPPRQAMVSDQIAGRGVGDGQVLAAMGSVPRHLFVPAGSANDAYGDYPLPIGSGQTISQPYIVAYMSELLAVQKTHKVLEVGTGSGYQAAVLSLLADRVYSIEIVEELGREAAARLEKLGYGNVEVRIGNGYLGWPEEAPFDRIMLTAAPEEIPPALLAQLAPNGILVAPVGPAFSAQELVAVQKDAAGRMQSRSVLPVRFVPMVQKPQP